MSEHGALAGAQPADSPQKNSPQIAATLKTIVLGGRIAGPKVLISGGVHGDEYEPMQAIRQLGAALEHAEVTGTLTLCPCANEAAFLNGSRTGIDGLDLARVCPSGAVAANPTGTVTERSIASNSKAYDEHDTLS